MKILYVEDDADLSFLVKDNLEMKGYTVNHAADGVKGLLLFKTDEPDLCLLDVNLPKKDGFTLAKEIRELNTEVPIIFVTAKSLPEDKIEGLTIGGDDYIVKPFSMDELLLKVNVFLKRRKIESLEEQTEFSVGKCILNTKDLVLTTPAGVSKLTVKETLLLEMFFEKPNDLIKREHILQKIWGQEDFFFGRSLDVFMSRFRKFIKSDESLEIETVYGAGFRLNVKS
jgi:two-component system, OmpR family, response regulator VicR